MSTHKKILGNAFAQIMGQGLGALASFVIVKIITTHGAGFYGNYLTAYEFLAFFGIIADAGLYTIAVREISKEPKNSESILGNIFSMRLIMIIAVVILAGVSAQFVDNYPPEVKLGIWITAISMALTIVAGTLSSVLQAKMKIQYFSGSLVTGKFLLAGLIFLISKNAGFFGDNLLLTLLWAGVISNVVFCSLVAFFVSRLVKIRLRFDFTWWRKILTVSLPYGLALILQTLYLRLDLVLISILLTMHDAGIYGVATRVLESFLVLGVFFGQASLPKISADGSHHEEVEKTLVWGIEKLLLFSIPIIIGIFSFARDIIRIISTPEFISTPGFFGSDRVLQVLIGTIFFAYLNQLFTYTLVAKNRQNYLLIVNSVALGTNALLNILLLPHFGIAAAAGATIFCEMVVFGLLCREIHKYFRFPFSLRNFGIIALANLVLIAEIYLTPIGEKFTLAAAVCSLSYVIVLFLFRKDLLGPKEKPVAQFEQIGTDEIK